MDIKLISAKDATDIIISLTSLTIVPSNPIADCIEALIKDIQRNAIEVAVQRCSEEADADYNVVEEGSDPEAYVISYSILDCKQKLFEENNLI